jgi:hypothetical protein
VRTLDDAATDGHAKMSPSKAHRWLVCPGSMKVQARDPESEWATEGTRKHAVLAALLRGTPVVAGDTIPTECGPYKVPLPVLEQCHEIKEFIDQFCTMHPEWTIEAETKVEIGSHLWPDFPKGLCAGTADVAAYSFTELLVLDAKFGFVEVEARGNPQLMLYALGLLAEVPFPIEHVTLCIAQPGWDGEVIFREHRTTAAELREWALSVAGIVQEVQSGSYRLQADDHACHYCPARTSCPARLQALDNFNHDEWMAERDIADLLPYLPRLRAICKDIEQRAVQKLAAGEPVRGFKLVAAKSRRKWQEEIDPPSKVGMALEALGVKVQVSQLQAPRVPLSPAQMEKKVRELAKLPAKAAKALVEEAGAFQPTGKPKLAPESDPRPALAADPGWTLADLAEGDGDADA